MAAMNRQPWRSLRRYRSQAILLAVGFALVVSLCAWAFVSHRAGSRAPEPPAMSEPAFEEATGIQLVRIAVTAGGGMLDLRYRVLDPDRSIIVHDPRKPPAIIDESTGRTASRPWMPHHSGKDLHLAQTYYELIVNPGGVIRRGNTVTLVIGDARLSHVVVQ
jgi:hypothetical protein